MEKLPYVPIETFVGPATASVPRLTYPEQAALDRQEEMRDERNHRRFLSVMIFLFGFVVGALIAWLLLLWQVMV